MIFLFVLRYLKCFDFPISVSIMIKTYIERKIYTEKVRPFMNKDIIKVFVGQRRVGKSYLLFQIMDLIKNDFGRDSNIIYINKEANEFENVKTIRICWICKSKY